MISAFCFNLPTNHGQKVELSLQHHVHEILIQSMCIGPLYTPHLSGLHTTECTCHIHVEVDFQQQHAQCTHVGLHVGLSTHTT